MKNFLVFLVIVCFMTLWVQPMFAQEPTVEQTAEPTVEPAPPGLPDKLPDTAAEGLNMLAVILGTLAGLAGTRLTTAIKDLPFLKDEEKTKLSGLVADLVAFITSTGIAYLVVWLTPLSQLLDSSGLWQVLLWAWPAAKAWFEVEARRKGVVLTPTVEEVR